MSDLFGDSVSSRERTLSSSASDQVLSKKCLTLGELKAMFSEMDSEVIEMIWQDSNKNPETAFNFLSEMSPTKPKSAPQPLMLAESVSSPPAVPITSNWSSLLTAYDRKQFSQPPSVKPKPVVMTNPTIVDVILERIAKPERIVVIMRGVPGEWIFYRLSVHTSAYFCFLIGSGKSFLARKLQSNGVVLSTDDFFINPLGQYVFIPNKLPEAHDWNHKRAEREIKAGTNPVVIDNTNLEVWIFF